jgi:predicted RecB family nuclease
MGALKGVAAGLSAAQAPRAPSIYLALSDDLEKAPSIGPKTAERFAQLGVKTVADFLAADPVALAPKLEARHITPQVIADWQAQARLVLSVPGLRGTHAQLLTGAGFRTAQAVAKADTDKLCAAVLAYAASGDGQRLLRDGTPPDLARIKEWCEAARRAVAA